MASKPRREKEKKLCSYCRETSADLSIYSRRPKFQRSRIGTSPRKYLRSSCLPLTYLMGQIRISLSIHTTSETSSQPRQTYLCGLGTVSVATPATQPATITAASRCSSCSCCRIYAPREYSSFAQPNLAYSHRIDQAQILGRTRPHQPRLT